MKATKLFITGGKATFTVKSVKGNHYTFKVVRKDATQGGDIFFVNLLTGQNNETDFTYMGLLNVYNGSLRITAKSRYNAETVPVKVFNWAVNKIFREIDFPEGYSADTDDCCGRCGRTLTHPDGVNEDGFRHGFGPECWSKISQ
jgi:hypothetical protein